MEEHGESPRSVVGTGVGGPDGAAGAKRGHRTACNSCKRMKVRCEWDQEGVCNRCAKHQTECIFTIPERKKREKKETYLTTLEDRLNRMEAVMRQSGLSMPGKEQSSNPESTGLSDIPDKLSVLKLFDDGSTLFLGASSGFSIFGQLGLKWVSDVTGSDEFARAITAIPSPQAHSALVDTPAMWHRIPDNELTPLPSVQRAKELIYEFFNGFATIFPLFSRPLFLERFSRQYPVTPTENAAWFACLNVVFAIGAVSHNKHSRNASPRSTASSARSQNPEDEVWWPWFRNASSTYIDLQFREGNIAAVQAMIGMAFILQSLPNPYPCSVLAGAALRQAQAIGLHRGVTDVGFSPEQVEERRNVFWTGVTVERSILMRSGRPSVMQEDDIGVDLPKPDKTGSIGPEHPQPIRYMSTLSLLQGRIYNKLYSARATTRPVLEKLQWVSTLDQELQEWKDNLPIEIRPGNDLNVPCEQHLPILMMHYGYFNSLATIHRCSIHYKSWADSAEASFNATTLASMKLNPRVFASGAITVGAARSVIDLLKQTEDHIDLTETNVVRMLDFYPLSACLVLFANVLQNPRDPRAQADIGLMRYAVKFLSDTVDDDGKTVSSMVYQIFRVVIHLASQYVEKTLAHGTQTSKRARDPRDPLKMPDPSVDYSQTDEDLIPPTTERPGGEHVHDSFRSSVPSSASKPPPPSTSHSCAESAFTSTPSTYPPALMTQPAPTPSTQQSFIIQQDSTNQPNTTQQFLNDPLAIYNNELYNSNMAGLDSMSTLDTGMGRISGMGGMGTGVDFFPNNVLMPPTDGSWFFPLSPGMGNTSGNGFGGGGLGQAFSPDMGSGNNAMNVDAAPIDGGMSQDQWLDPVTTSTGLDYWSPNIGAGQNIDWGFGSMSGNEPRND